MTLEPLFHPTTALALHQLKQQLPQSLLVTGPQGSGLTTAARWLTDNTFVEQLVPRDAKGNQTLEGTIGVEAIRDLYTQTRTRSTKRQVILLKNAEQMSPAASGAFLKLLEEPGRSIHFILTSHQPHKLLPTIRSRVQSTEIKPLTTEQTAAFLDRHAMADTTKRRQLLFIAAGLPAELSRLMSDEAYFQEKARIISDARDFLKSNSYQKLLTIHTYRQDRDRTLQLCDAILTLLEHSLVIKPQPPLVAQIERLLAIRERIAANGNAALQLAQFVV